MKWLIRLLAGSMGYWVTEKEGLLEPLGSSVSPVFFLPFLSTRVSTVR